MVLYSWSLPIWVWTQPSSGHSFSLGLTHWLDTGTLEHKTFWPYCMLPVPICSLNFQIEWLVLNRCIEFHSSRAAILKVWFRETLGPQHPFGDVFIIIWTHYLFSISHSLMSIQGSFPKAMWHVISLLWTLMEYVLIYTCVYFLF